MEYGLGEGWVGRVLWGFNKIIGMFIKEAYEKRIKKEVPYCCYPRTAKILTWCRTNEGRPS